MSSLHSPNAFPDDLEGSGGDAPESRLSPELVASLAGTGADFELRLGEHTPIRAGDAQAAGRAQRFRDVLGVFATGVTVVTSTWQGEPVGMTCQSFSSVSLEPPLVMFCPATSSRAWPLIEQSGFFCVNVLAADQEDLSDAMATRGPEKFTGVGWRPAASGAPVLDGVLGHVDCRIERVHESGDHFIVVGRVQELSLGDGGHGNGTGQPLLFHRGAYTRLE